MRNCLAFTLTILPLQLFAVGDEDPAAAAWSGEGELGFTSIAGNSEAENLNARLGITRNVDAWKHALTVEAVRAETDGELSTNYARLREKSEYSLGVDSYAYGQLRYEDDEFSGFDYRASLTAGYGRRVLDDERQRLDLSAGIGMRRSKETDSGDGADDTILGGDLIYEYRFSDTAAFSAELLVEDGDENTYFESNTALKTRINDSLAAKISYLVKRNSSVPSGSEKTDRISTVSLLYEF